MSDRKFQHVNATFTYNFQRNVPGISIKKTRDINFLISQVQKRDINFLISPVHKGKKV